MVQINKILSCLGTCTGALVLVLGLSACKVQVGGAGYYPSYGSSWNNRPQHHHDNHFNGDHQQQRPRPRPNRPRPNRPTDQHPNRPNRPRPPRPERNEQAQLSQKVQTAALKLKKVSLYKNDTQVAFLRNSQSGEVQMQLKFLDAKSKKNIAVAYNLKDLELDDVQNPETIKVGFCEGQECANNSASANAWKLVVDRKSNRSLLEGKNGQRVFIDSLDSQRVLGVTEELVEEMKEYEI